MSQAFAKRAAAVTGRATPRASSMCRSWASRFPAPARHTRGDLLRPGRGSSSVPPRLELSHERSVLHDDLFSFLFLGLVGGWQRVQLSRAPFPRPCASARSITKPERAPRSAPLGGRRGAVAGSQFLVMFLWASPRRSAAAFANGPRYSTSASLQDGPRSGVEPVLAVCVLPCRRRSTRRRFSALPGTSAQHPSSWPRPKNAAWSISTTALRSFE